MRLEDDIDNPDLLLAFYLYVEAIAAYAQTKLTEQQIMLRIINTTSEDMIDEVMPIVEEAMLFCKRMGFMDN